MMKKLLVCLIIGCLMIVAGCGEEAMSEPEISVWFHEEGTVRQMKLEQYLEGVVAGEMKNDWPQEALKAQAIVARTYTLAKMAEGKLAEHNTDASTDIREFQAYQKDAVNDAVKQAVQTTRGQVITHEGAPIMAWFSASAGGQTATAEEGLGYTKGPLPYIQPVMSPDEDAPDDVKAWEVTFTHDEMERAVESLGYETEKVNSVMVTSYGPSGRATKLLINGKFAVSAPELRIALDSMKIKSTMLDDVTVDADGAHFAGRGYGHGVGMSQWGAHHMASTGSTAEDIVKHYYPSTTVTKWWE